MDVYPSSQGFEVVTLDDTCTVKEYPSDIRGVFLCWLIEPLLFVVVEDLVFFGVTFFGVIDGAIDVTY